MTSYNEYVLKRIESMEAELDRLKRGLSAKPLKRRRVTLRGIWKGADISDEDIEEAKRSLFKPAYDEQV